MGAYARLARLPPPKLGSVDVSQWLHRVVALEDRARITVVDGPAVTISADGDQLDQLLINLLRQRHRRGHGDQRSGNRGVEGK